MSLKKKEFRLRSTESGQIGWTAGLWLILFMGCFLCALLQLDALRMSAQYLEDALAASNLAAAVIDVEEYGISHRLQISDLQAARRRYETAVKGNLGLDESWECQNRGLISGPVQIVNFTVYNVSGDEVEIHYFDENGVLSSSRGSLGQVRAPNGVLIESTGIYSELRYHITGFLGMETEAYKGKLADVKRTQEDEEAAGDA
ncbi:MAG: hypothetical protein NC432_07155 [Roseburia sp.]|nr:hypothetical protein [Roseburia sp.]MCM1098930.1 hypothetical protein [Ruminococcus flavefaciens]